MSTNANAAAKAAAATVNAAKVNATKMAGPQTMNGLANATAANAGIAAAPVPAPVANAAKVPSANHPVCHDTSPKAAGNTGTSSALATMPSPTPP